MNNNIKTANQSFLLEVNWIDIEEEIIKRDMDALVIILFFSEVVMTFKWWVFINYFIATVGSKNIGIKKQNFFSSSYCTDLSVSFSSMCYQNVKRVNVYSNKSSYRFIIFCTFSIWGFFAFYFLLLCLFTSAV
jgi:hypothetical protein